jgi:hypothetical protein
MADLLIDILFVACVALVAVGAGLVYLPAGLITGGVLGAAGLGLYDRARRPE